MFAFQRLHRQDAMSLVDRCLAGLAGLPQNDVRDEHLSLYRSIRAVLSGQSYSIPRVRETGGALVESHKVAAELLASIARGTTQPELRSVLGNRHGWYDSHGFRWDESGGITQGSGQSYFVLFFFPAVRLSLFAAGLSCGWRDPAFDWTCERRSAELAVKEIIIPQWPTGVQRDEAVAKLRDLANEMPGQEVLHATLGHLLLQREDFEDARESLERALALPACGGRKRGGVLYNLACCCARTGDPDGCREYIFESARVAKLDLAWMKKDPDLESVRSLPWFRDLAAGVQ